MRNVGCLFLFCSLGLSNGDMVMVPQGSHGACGGVPERHTELQGFIRSPVARDWLEELNCTWVIEATSQELLTISFEAFDLACYAGLLTIWTSGQAPSRLCGNSRPRPLTFTGGKVYVNFRTGYSRHSTFKLSYLKGSPCQAGWTLCGNGDCLPASHLCGPSTPRPTAPPLSCSGARELGGFYGAFSSPDYGAGRGALRPACDCSWSIDTGDRRPLLLSFPRLALGWGDRLEVYEGKRGLGPLRPLAELSYLDNTREGGGGHPRAPTRSLGTASGAAFVRYRSTGGWGIGGFNATYQVRGYCPPWQRPCLDGGTPSCYTPGQHCDGTWDCEGGRDEQGCPRCQAGRYPCGDRSGSCYALADRCNYQTYCPGGADERECRQCQPGTFHCADDRCVFETWACDGQPDCADGSDERDCERPLPRKVATAAVVGSLVCGLLLVVAMGCTCKLYSLRTSQYSLFTPLARMEAEMVQRRAPPSYGQLIAQGAIPPVEDFPTENPNDTSVIGNIRSLLQLLRQESPPRPHRRRRRNRYLRRLSRRFRRTRLYALLTRSRAGQAPAPEPSADPAPATTASAAAPASSSSSPGALPLPRKFPLCEGAPPAPDPPASGLAASVFGDLSRREGAQLADPRGVLLVPLAGSPGATGDAEGDDEALIR